MDKDEDRSNEATLLSRHWIIEDGNGEKQEVRGPGIIGLYPNMKKGSYMEYCSCTNLTRKIGKMSGELQFKNNSTGEIYDIYIDPFILDVEKCE